MLPVSTRFCWATQFVSSTAQSPRDVLDAALLRAARTRLDWIQQENTSAFRLAHIGELPISGLAIDIYNSFAVLHCSSSEATARSSEVAQRLIARGIQGCYVKFRPKQSNILANTRREEIAPALPIAGEPAPSPMAILEQNDPFLVRLNDGLSTGIFLDQRANRKFIRNLASGRRVLNLFAYACAFSVSAAQGNAASVVSVDISKTALVWGQENLHLSGHTDPKRFRFIVDEAFLFLKRCAIRGDRYDLILLDPPSYATTKGNRFTAEHDYQNLLQAALSILSPHGYLLACTNHRGISSARFLSFVKAASRNVLRESPHLKQLPPPKDFPEPPGTEPYLKAILLEAR